MTEEAKVAAAVAKKNRKTHKISVADYIGYQLEITGKSQASIAREVGWTQNNMISMLKSGKIKLPLHRVKPLARALGVDSSNLMKMCIEEYYPEVAEVMQEMGGQPMLTRNEIEMINLLRDTDPNDPRVYTESQEENFRKFVHTLTSSEERARVENLRDVNERIARERLIKEKAKIEAQLKASEE